MVTVASYFKAHPRSILASQLVQKFGLKSRVVIHNGSGTISTSKQANLGKMLERYGCSNYTVGGRAGKKQERWVCVCCS